MFCKICGTNNVPQAVFCETCGAKLYESTTSQNEATPVYEITPDYEMPEAVEEEMYDEYEEPPKKKKSTVVLIVLLVILASLICVAVGILLSGAMNTDGVGFADNSSSSGNQQQEQPAEEDEEEKEEKSQEQIDCEKLVKDLMDAVENENEDVVEDQLEFECGDSDDLAEKMAKTIGTEFGCDYTALEDVSEKLLTEYFYSMVSNITESEKSGGEYTIKVSFTRLDKESVIKEILKFDADGYREELREKYETSEEQSEETEAIGPTDEEIDEMVEEELLKKIVEVANDKITKAELITDELIFVVAEDEGEWFIYADGSNFEDLEKELTLED